MSRETRWALVAGGLYLAAALWHVRVVLPAPATLLALNPEVQSNVIAIGDQQIVVATIARGARTLVTEPWRLYDGGQCFPMPNALTLGEHIIGNGLLAIAPYWLSGGEPVFAANAVYVLELWIAAMAMFALVLHWTGSVGPAIVAGFLFGFLPTRLQDPGHPFLHGNQWTPLVLLFVHRLFAGGGWRDAAALTLFVCLQALESFYQLWALTLLLIVFGIGLAVRHRRRLVRVVPLLAASMVVVGALVWAIMAPYLETARTWGILTERGGLLLFGGEVLPGGLAYPGSVSLILTAVALLDRLRGRRALDDPRLLFFVMGFIMVWAVLGAVPIPGVGSVPSLTILLKKVVPGLMAGRGLRTARMGIYVVTSFLAGYGLFVATAGRGRVVRMAILVIVAVAAVGERLVPSYAATQFRFSTRLAAREARPSNALLALYRELPPGPVLDLPHTRGIARALQDQGHYTFLGAYHHHQTGSCYNSNAVAIQDDVASLAERLPDPTAIDAVHAIGFRTLVVHAEGLGPIMLQNVVQPFEAQVAAGTLRRIGEADAHFVYAIAKVANPMEGPACLQPKVSPSRPVELVGPSALVPFEFRAMLPRSVCREPDPFQPTGVTARWRERAGPRMMSNERVRTLLPIAVGNDLPLVRNVRLRLPPPGEYMVTLSADVLPFLVIAVQAVTVVPAEGVGPSTGQPPRP